MKSRGLKEILTFRFWLTQAAACFRQLATFTTSKWLDDGFLRCAQNDGVNFTKKHCPRLRGLMEILTVRIGSLSMTVCLGSLSLRDIISLEYSKKTLLSQNKPSAFLRKRLPSDGSLLR